MLPLFATIAMAQEDEWHPVAEWPFIYQNFQKANIYVGATNKKVTAKSNIHIKQGRLWFISGKDNKTKLQAKPGTINKVVFANGIQFIPIEDRLCEVIRQDTIDGKICAVYHDVSIDMQRYNEMVSSNMGSIADGIDIARHGLHGLHPARSHKQRCRHSGSAAAANYRQVLHQL